MAGSGSSGRVRCPGCGREYQAALFAGGRTLHCACGRRVGGERLAPRPASDGRPRFFADAMLGRLARWLRVLGVDTAWEAHIPDEVLVRRSRDESRIVLTRDRRMPEEWRYAGITLVEAESPREQLAEVVRRFGLAEGARPFSRCVRCNTPLEEVAADRADAHVPERIRRDHATFRRCPVCEQSYWPGSHVARMREALESILGVELDDELAD